MKFADDLAAQRVFNINEINEADTELNSFLKDLENWLNKWRLEMALAKCKYIIFSQKKMTTLQLNLRLYGINLEKDIKNNPKFLGVIFDPQLKFTQHVDYIVKKMTSRLNIIKLVAYRKWKIGKSSLRSTYISLISSILEYTAGILEAFTEKSIGRLQVVQNNAIRVILGYHKVDKMRIQDMHEKLN